jgi:hypothetical protein
VNPPALPRPRPVGRLFALLFVVIVVVGLLPLILAFGASYVADAAGCVLNEASAHPCLIGGIDFGETLAALFLMHWLALATLPLAAIALGIWLVALVVVLFLRWRARRRAGTA